MGAGPKDRKTTIKERVNPTHPLPPLNLDVLYGFDSKTNAFDIYWDNPSQLCGNQEFTILGVNLYRSFDSEYGPFERLNDLPLGTTFYRDHTTNALVEEEDVSSSFLARGKLDDESGRYIFRVEHYPIVKIESEAVSASHPTDVKVFIDGKEVVPYAVYGYQGQVELRVEQFYDVSTNSLVDPILPDPDSVVTCTYRYNTNVVQNELDRKVWYRCTTVGTRDGWDGELRESPLEWGDAKTVHHIENLDHIWREAIRRNAWILDQGGERVKVFIRKWNGVRCDLCYDDTYKRARNDCKQCFGTSIIGGYEGPFAVIMAPPDAEKRVNLGEHGFHLEQTQNVWMGPSPLMSQRDFIVKQNNVRYSIGPVKVESNRGSILQQSFDVNLISENDIRYEVPVYGTQNYVYPETRTHTWDDSRTELNYPQITEDPTTPDSIEERGRTPTYDNINKKA
jgi:hypothetical protein